jgi:phenylalanyl-tRNA synthetase beta chain
MKVSYNWLNEYFQGKLPAPEKLENLLTMYSMEIDGIEKVGGDFVIDAKTTPNLNHFCLCHRGIAREAGVILNLPAKKYSRDFQDFQISETAKKLSVKIVDEKLCRRYIGRVIENIQVGESPKWLKEKLETLGQRSINNIVDATNFVMLEIGQPMHAFDADKITSEIVIQKATQGQKITTLDKKEVMLDESILLITDGKNPLALAGIKGGNYAELDVNTKNIILESANFNPTLIRKTAQKIKIQTDASKRFENDLTPELCGEAMDILTKLIVEIAGTKETRIGEVVDVYPKKEIPFTLGISAREASDILGIEIASQEIENIFDRFGFTHTKVSKSDESCVVTVPAERLDIRLKEDLAEEIGRIYGYENIKDITISQTAPAKIDKAFAYKEKIRKILDEEGFSEVMNYTFTDQGEIELANPMSPERKFLRTNLTDGIKNCLQFNVRYIDFLGIPQIKIFEFGHVFSKAGEYEHFIIGIHNPLGLKKPTEKETLVSAIKILSEKLGALPVNLNAEENIAEFDFDTMLQNFPDVEAYDFSVMGNPDIKFKKISSYPYMVRDIAVFTPDGTKAEQVLEIIQKEAGELMIKNRLFDEFTKVFPDGTKKISYGYRIIFQSYEKTLSDEEVNKIIEKITAKMNGNPGWQVR